jgi:ABC-type antimicrobial peptide transport system permease subunit
MALGADRVSVLLTVLRSGLRTTLLGLGAGLLIAVWIARLMAGLLYRTSPLDAAPYAAAAVALLVVSLAAVYVPARRAAAIDPASALR